VFLEEGTCTIHDIRPTACRMYPWVQGEDGFKTEDFCPYHDEFPGSEEVNDKLADLLKQLEIEGQERNICKKHDCHACCLETEMPLSTHDMNRITGLGFRDFSIERDGEIILRNIEGRCFFLSGKGKCRIYESRPEGCGFYPFVLGKQGAEMDKDCPHGKEFLPRLSGKIEIELIELVERLNQESR